MRFFSFFLALASSRYVQRACNQISNEIWLRHFDLGWEEIISENFFCSQLFEISIYRYSYTQEEIDESVCKLVENVVSKVQFEILRLWRRKTGKVSNC